MSLRAGIAPEKVYALAEGNMITRVFKTDGMFKQGAVSVCCVIAFRQ